MISEILTSTLPLKYKYTLQLVSFLNTLIWFINQKRNYIDEQFQFIE